MRWFARLFFFFPIFLGLALLASAHDIPSDVTVHAFVRPAGDRLQVLVRLPLKVMRDMEFPEQPNGYLDLERLAPKLHDAATVWIAQFLELREGPERLPAPQVAATQISLPSDRSFESFDRALAHIAAPALTNGANVIWNQVLLDVLLEAPIRSPESRFSIHPGLRHLAAKVVTVLRFQTPGGTVRAFEFTGDPGLVPLDPRWHQAAWRFVELGFFHILDGADHLLFLFCLVIPFRRLVPLVGVVTAFTAAHSLTLLASAAGLAPEGGWFPPLIETLIAASIVYMALENIAGGATVTRRWVTAFAFGLVHGFGFSFALKETLQFAGSHLLTSLVSFNVGVELGQLLVLIALVPLIDLLFRYGVAERMGTIILSALVAHTGWHWMADRWDLFRQYPLPGLEAGVAARALIAVAWIAGLAGLGTLIARQIRRRSQRTTASDPV